MTHILRVVLTTLVFAVAAYPQLARGTITGTVTDPTGAVIPRVQVTITNSATGAVYNTVSSEAGRYLVPNLPGGPYQALFEAPGFKKLLRGNVTLAVAENLRLDAALEVGPVAESIEVHEEVARLQTETPDVGTTLSNRQLLDLPLNFGEARTAESFAYKIAPGVAGDAWTSYVNGSTAFSKETLLDGAPVSTNYAGTFVFSNPSVEALQEFKVQTSGLSAEFGRTQGGVFNYVLKSGTNELHGSLYGSLRNEALDANSFANNAQGQKRPLNRKQNYAGSIGGPVYIPKVYNGKNRSFFYTAYERFRERSLGFGAPTRTFPVPEFYEGDFSRLLGTATGQTDALGRPVLRGAVYDPASFSQLPTGRWIGDMFPGNRIPVSRFSQVSQKLNALAKAGYMPQARDASGQVPLVRNALYPVVVIPVFDQYQYSAKGDQIISNNHKLAISYSFTYRPRLLADSGGMWSTSDPEGGPLSKAREQRQKTNLARVAHDWTITPRLLNHLTVFLNRLAAPGENVHKDIDGAKELGIKGLSTYGYPIVNWGSGPAVTLENPGETTKGGTVHGAIGFIESLSFSSGRHFMKAGFDLRRNYLNVLATQGGSFNFAARGTAIPNEAFSGNLTGYSFASYLLGIVDTAGLTDPVPLGARRRYYAAFFQDDFKVSSRLTLQIGIRWEYQPPFTEAANRLSSWNLTKTDPESRLPGAYDFAGSCEGCTGSSYFGSKSFRDWGPRFGFAWRMTERWVVRGAYGIVYVPDLFESTAAMPLGKANNVAWGGTWNLTADPVRPWAGIFNWDAGFPTNRYVPPSFDVSWANRNQAGMIDPLYGNTAYVQNWNLNIQRQLPWNLVLDVGYIGNKSTGLYEGEMKRVNQLPPSTLVQYGRNLNNAVTSPAEAAANGIPYPYPGYRGTVAGALRQYPQVQGTQIVQHYGSPLGFSTYHSLQVTVNRQFAGGLTAYANYVWSKTLSNIDTSAIGGNTGRPLDYYNLGLEKAVAGMDIPHMFKGYVDYELPFGRGRKFGAHAGKLADAFIGGWSVSAIVNYYNGVPLGFGGTMPLASGWNGAANRANIAAGELKTSGYSKSAFELSAPSSAVNTYLVKSQFSDPTPLTLGTSAPRYTQVRSFGTVNEDVGLQKNHRFGEKFRFQLRADFLNAFNRHQLGGIITAITNPLFGQVTGVSGNRVIQIGARMDF
jgi:hypothetical protein